MTTPPPPNQDWPSVTILILNWNGQALLQAYLPSITQLNYPGVYQIVVIDNHSEDDSLPFLQANYPHIRTLVNDENLGFSRGVNVGLAQTSSDVVVLLNNDVEVEPYWLTALIGPLLADDTIGITGTKLLFPDGRTLQHAGASLEYPLAIGKHRYYRETDNKQADSQIDVEYVTGAAMAISRRVLDSIGLLDEAFSPFYYEEADYCWRTQAAGYRVVYVPTAVAIHHESLSMRRVNQQLFQYMQRNRLYFVLKHYTPIQFLDDFVPAEETYLQTWPHAWQWQRLRRIYLEMMIRLPAILQTRNETEQLPAYTAALMTLGHTAVTKLPTTHQPLATLTPFNFSSDIPGVATLRQATHSIAGKWAEQHLVQQQSAINKQLSQWLDSQRVQDQALAADITLLARELAAIQLQFAQTTDSITGKLAGLHTRLDKLETLVE